MSNIDFINACVNGNLELAQQLLNNLESIDYNLIFLLVCKNGQLNVAQWLYSLNVDIHTERKCIFKWTSEEGHLAVAKWARIVSLNVDIYSIYEKAFIMACKNGHLEIAQWLQSLNVDIHVDNEYAFRLACRNGHLKIVQWLYQFNVNLIFINYVFPKEISREVLQLDEKEIELFEATINTDKEKIKELIKDGVNYEFLDHFVFKKSCYNNKFQIVNFLSKLNLRYHFKSDGNKIINYKVKKLSKNARNTINF